MPTPLVLTPNPPKSRLASYPCFELLLADAARKLGCTIDHVRRDYWSHRAWRALLGDVALASRFARLEAGTVLLTGPGFGAPPTSLKERDRWRFHVRERLKADLAPARPGTLELRRADGAVNVELLEVRALLSATSGAGVEGFGADLGPMLLPVVRGSSSRLSTTWCCSRWCSM